MPNLQATGKIQDGLVRIVVTEHNPYLQVSSMSVVKVDLKWDTLAVSLPDVIVQGFTIDFLAMEVTSRAKRWDCLCYL